MADATDVVVREYPVYASTIDNIFKDRQKLALFEYPQRPPWRPYDVEGAERVQYKPGCSMVQMQVPQEGADNNYIQLKGQGGAHEGTLCVMVKVDGAFTLLPVDEIIQLRTDMQRFNATEGKAAAAEDDPDYKPPPVKKETEKSVMRQLQVEVTKRETERQQEMRVRSHAYMREQQDRELWQTLRMHSKSEASSLLMAACRKVIKENEGDLKMDMSASEYLDMVSPSTWIGDDGSAPKGPDTGAAPAPKAIAAKTLTTEELAAVTAALTSLFEAHSVVSMDDVRSWLRGYTANPAAAKAANVTDAALHGLLVGGGSILAVKGRYVLAITGNETSDPFRKLVLELLESSEDGFKKADVMGAAKLQDMDISEHLYNKVLKDLCVASGAVWSMRQGANF